MAKKQRKTSRIKTTARQHGQGGLSHDETQHFKELLLEKRKEIVGNVNEIEDETLRQSRMAAAGDLSSMPIHMADLGSDNYEQEFALGLMDSEIKLLREIDAALERIENGTYGICRGTGKAICKARLEAQPWAAYSVAFAEQIEQGLVTKPQEQ